MDYKRTLCPYCHDTLTDCYPEFALHSGGFKKDIPYEWFLLYRHFELHQCTHNCMRNWIGNIMHIPGWCAICGWSTDVKVSWTPTYQITRHLMMMDGLSVAEHKAMVYLASL